jgi:hypothetical protein
MWRAQRREHWLGLAALRLPELHSPYTHVRFPLRSTFLTTYGLACVCATGRCPSPLQPLTLLPTNVLIVHCST